MSLLPFDDRDGWIWYNGEFIPWRQAKIHILSHSLHYGGCVFEGERSYGGHIFKSNEHSVRLGESAQYLGYQLPCPAEEIDQIKRDVISRMGLEDCYIRALAWRGSEMMAVSAQSASIHMAVAAWKWGEYFADRLEGIRITVSRWKRPSPETIPCHAKASGLYMICTLSKHEAEASGYADALMLDYRGYIAETTGANIFFIRDGRIHTPVPDCFLDGITRRTVIGLAKRRGYEVIERVILPEEISDFSECFVTGTAAEITPVIEIKGHVCRPSGISLSLIEDFDELIKRAVKRQEKS